MEGTLGPLLLLALPVVLLIMVSSRARRQQRELRVVQDGLSAGSDVMMGSGLYGIVVEVQDDVVVLETAPGQRSRWDRRAVVRIITPESQSLTPPQSLTDTPPETT